MIEIPKNCPCCSSLLERVKDQLFCRNKQCSDQNSKRVESFCKKAKIKGFGEKTLEKLQLLSIPELYDLTYDKLLEALESEKISNSLLKELEISKTMLLSTFISALSIPLIGKAAAEKLVAVISSIEEISEITCKKAGLGTKATESLMLWKKQEYYKYKSLPLQLSVETKPALSNSLSLSMTVCTTGKIEGYTRASLQEYLNSLGIKMTSAVSKNTDFLVCDDPKGSSKEKKAEALQIEILTLNQLIDRNNKV